MSGLNKKILNKAFYVCRYKLLPRMLRDVAQCDTKTKILGHDIAFPVGVAPTAMNRMAHPDGEVAVAKGF